MLKKIYFLMLFMCFTNQAIAADQCAAWGCISRIENLVIQDSGRILINTPLDQSIVNCKLYGNTYFVVSSGQPRYKELYSMLLSAYLTKTKVQLRIVEGSTNCEISYIRMSNAYK
ncbi:hypothetical protein EXE30_04035 [Acinetobacter halotolerans]|uniref:Uncharacterized protein n=1 Tax=Acinetobacter halotolerans TaxID=1752076 RepID=A0A4Q6XMN2_9GAMM|nr:hypothetical protein [Acinetobacter halotolerans]RZF55977.1 hypothetical protein EXE30_04035 [Acinetobacter halotolerans]